MNNIDNILDKSGRVLISGCPEGFDSQILAHRALSGIEPISILHIARDETRLVTLAEELAFFAPGLEVLRFPAWDSVPYDRVSPHGEVVARRVETLSKLAGKKDIGATPFIVITTVSAFLQRVPPKSLFAGAAIDISPGGMVNLDEFTAFLVTNGYHRAETVREPGEYALRGGLIDIFPPGTLEPLRLDLFGDEVEDIRAFDPMTQLTTGKRESLTLIPVSEMTLDATSITRFRTGYRELFGVAGSHDPLYEAISAGRRFDGMEHWLPLFHAEMACLSDYMPKNHALTFDHQAVEARTARLEMIDDYYEARKAMTTTRQAMELTYKPLPPKDLFLDAKEWEALTLGRPVGVFSPFKTPQDTMPEDYRDSVDAGGRGGRDFSQERTRPEANLFDAVSDVIKGEKRPVVITAFSAGARERLTGLLNDHGIEKLVHVENWGDVQSMAPSSAGLAVLPLDTGFRSPQALFISEQDILGQRLARATTRRRKAEDFISEASSLTEGDLVVHVEHGVGRFDGLMTIDAGGAPHDCVQLTYEGGDKLFVPVENIEILSRYGSEGAGRLDKLGGASWQARKSRVKKRIKDIADELIKIAAARALREGEEMTPPAGLYEEFCARFPYPETEDQNRAIDDMIADLASGRPMDRLICGDVGFGKTEVAMRAAFIAAMSGIQVAVVTPTTLLCRQHFQSFCERFT
ncbi:MAG: transcription-repair coupling factor, partial [Rhodospirillaceae bacterium]|nr:transcription-repair coupling factor [Rhodospirillaceae bacterium]